MAPKARLAARWMNSLVFPIFCRRHRAISSASWSMLFFKDRKRSPRVLMARRDTLERRLVTLERGEKGPPGQLYLPKGSEHSMWPLCCLLTYAKALSSFVTVEEETFQYLWAERSLLL